MRVAIFGAGASAGAAGLPPARDFARHLREARPHWERDYPHLARVVADLEAEEDDWDLGQAWTRLDDLQKLGWALGLRGDLSPAAVELRRALLDVYGAAGRGLQQAVAREQSSAARRLVAGLRPGDAIVSFNYDVLVEHLALSAGLELHQAPCRRCRGRRRCVQLIKPHGSLAWAVVRAGRGKARVHWRGPGGRPLVRPPPAERISARSLPLVLGVVPVKSELLREVQVFHEAEEVHEVIKRQWRAALEAVRQARRLTVVGYSFPAEDRYGRFLFREAARARPARRPLEVEFYELERNAFEIARRLFEVFGVWPRWLRAV